jgi:phosphatidylinositol alpha 1,6-mannosyltransferase
MAHDSLKRWVAKIHTRTTRTLAPSNWSCEDLRASGVSNVYLWPRGVDCEKFSPEKRDITLRCELLGDRPDRKLVGYVGRLANEKRIDDLATLDARDDIQLVIVGEGPARARLERVLTNAKFVGYQSGENLARYYASLDIFIHTGKHETFCQSVQEALASGVPVIAPNFGGPTDLIKHGWTGYLIDTANSYSLNHAVNQIIHLSEPSLMGFRARESVIERSWHTINTQLISHYEDLINSKVQADGIKVA